MSSAFPKIKIWNGMSGERLPVYITVDGKELHGVKSLCYYADTESVPTVEVGLDLNMNALDALIELDNAGLHVVLEYSPKTIEEAKMILERANQDEH